MHPIKTEYHDCNRRACRPGKPDSILMVCVFSFLEVIEVYNPYNPYGYLFPQNGQQQPFMPGMQQGMQSSMQQPMQSPIQAQQQANSSPVVMQVPSIKQVEQAPVQPGGKALVLVANEPVIAMRTADNMGLTTTDYYHIEKFYPDAAAPAPAGDFVPRAEFNQTIQTLLQQIQQLQKPAITPEKEAAKK